MAAFRWTTNLRDSLSPSPSPSADRSVPAAPSAPASLQDLILAEAERQGAQEKHERDTQRKEVIDIAQIEEQGTVFKENPFTIAARLAREREQRRRLGPGAEEDEREVMPVERNAGKNQPSKRTAKPTISTLATPFKPLATLSTPHKPVAPVHPPLKTETPLVATPLIATPLASTTTIIHTSNKRERKREPEEFIIYEDSSSIKSASLPPSPPPKKAKLAKFVSPALKTPNRAVPATPGIEDARLSQTKDDHNSTKKANDRTKLAKGDEGAKSQRDEGVAKTNDLGAQGKKNPFVKSSTFTKFSIGKPFVRTSSTASTPIKLPDLPRSRVQPSAIVSNAGASAEEEWSTLGIKDLLPRQSFYGSTVFEPSSAYHHHSSSSSSLGEKNPTEAISTRLALSSPSRPSSNSHHASQSTARQYAVSTQQAGGLKSVQEKELRGGRKLSLFCPTESLEEFERRVATTESSVGGGGGAVSGVRGLGVMKDFDKVARGRKW